MLRVLMWPLHVDRGENTATTSRPTCPAPTLSSGLAITYDRGFVARVSMDPDVFVEHGAFVLNNAPVPHVDFTPPRPGALRRLLASELLGRLDSVGFIAAGLDDDAVAQIAQCPYLNRCLYLDLSYNALTRTAFAALAASPYLRRLLVVERAQNPDLQPGFTDHPGEVVVTGHHGTGASTPQVRPITASGEQLLAAHGYLPWLYVRNHVSRYGEVGPGLSAV